MGWDIFKKQKKQEVRSYLDNDSLYNYLTYNSSGSYTESKSMNLAAAYRCVEVITDAVA